MEELLVKSAGFMLLIALGFAGKKVGLFHPEDRFVLSKIITLACFLPVIKTVRKRHSTCSIAQDIM